MKQLLAFQGPASSRSGYGDHTRDLLSSLIKMDRFEIKINDMPWGVCPRDGLKKGIHDDIIRCIMPSPRLDRQPDVFVQCSVPNEFNPIGKFNIGITAGIETTACSADWLQGLNRMDVNIVPSEHSKKVFLETVYDQKDQQGNIVGGLKTEKPIEVLFEGVNTKVFNAKNEIPETINDMFREIPEKFCYLVCGHWLKGDFGHDRKDLATTIRCFLETFKKTPESKRPALILKTSMATFSVADRENLLETIKNLRKSSGIKNAPEVYLLHGDLTEDEMNGLYNHYKVKAMVTFTKREGNGRPLAEFITTGKPIIVSNWSGHLDFCKNVLKLGGELQQVHQSAVWDKVILPEAKWFYVNPTYASGVIKEVFDNYKKYKEQAKKQKSHINKNFSLEGMDLEFAKIMDKYVPERKEIKLPKLKLPKLKTTV